MISNSELELAIPEKHVDESPRITQSKELIDRFHSIKNKPLAPNPLIMQGLLERYGTSLNKIINPVTNSTKPEGVSVIRTDPTNLALDKMITTLRTKFLHPVGNYEQRHLLGENQAEEYAQMTPDQRLDESLQDYESLLQLQQHLNTIMTTNPIAYKQLHQKVERVVNLSQGLALKNLIEKIKDLYIEDALSDTSIPTVKPNLTGEELEKAQTTIAAVKDLFIASNPNPELRKKYTDILTPLMENRKKIYDKEQPYQVFGIDTYKDLQNTSLNEALENFIQRSFIGWEFMDITTEQAQKIYDIVSPTLFQRLFAGGRESREGTSASGIFYNLHDPRALPKLIEHIRIAGSGHTTNSVVYTIREIVKNPLNEETLDRAINDSPNLTQKIIKGWFRESSSATSQIIQYEIERGMGGYAIASMIKEAEPYLARGELTNLAYGLSKAQGDGLDLETLKGFFFNYPNENTERVEDYLLSGLDSVADIIAKSRYVDWKLSNAKIFNTLITPPNGDLTYFPKIIAATGLNLEEEFVAKIEKIYQSGDLKRGIMSRTAFAEGLLFLSTKDNGSQIARTILKAATGANRDSERIREIFSLLRSLDSLEQFSFTPKNSLVEITADLKEKMVQAVAKKMELTEQELPILRERLLDLSKSGIFQIIPHLLARFQEQGRTEIASLVREIGRHVVLDDFEEWRNHLPASVSQLEILTDGDKKEAWLKSLPEISLSAGFSGDHEARMGAVDAVKRIASEAKAHIMEVFKLNFSSSGINVLRQQQAELIRKLKDPLIDTSEKKDLGERKRLIDNQLRIIEGIQGLENMSYDNFNPVKLEDSVAKISAALSSIPGLEQPVQDLNEISNVITTQSNISNLSVIKAIDTDDPLALLKVGVEPRETCQSYRNGSYNYCLPAYVSDANKRVINATNEKGEVLGRSIIKLTHIQSEDGFNTPAILLEPIYTLSEINSIYRAIVRIALQKAISTGSVLVVGKEIPLFTGADNTKTVPILQDEAKRMGLQYELSDTRVFIPPSNNQFEYSDTLGGAVWSSNTYTQLDNAVVIKPSTLKS